MSTSSDKKIMSSVLEKINRAGVKLLKPLTPEETYSTVVEEAVKLVKADFGSIFLDYSGQLERVYASDVVLHNVKIRRNGFTYKAFKTRQSVIVDIQEFSKLNLAIKKLGIKSDLIIPLFYRNKSIGVISLLSKKSNYFNDKHVEMLKLYASIASLAIRKTLLHEETEKALKSLDLLISMTTHEIKTPLTTIQGYVQLLEQKAIQNDLTQHNWIKELSWETTRLIQMVDEFLLLSKTNDKIVKLNLSKCSLKDIVNRALMTFKFNYPNYKVEIVDFLGEESDVLIGDFDKLLQVITNILNNAARYSDPKQQISLNLYTAGNYFVVKVTDQGIGIPKKDLKNIFQQFFRGNNAPTEGMGLGLFLVKKVLEQHKGKINIYSQLKKGTRVVIKLPKNHP